MLLQSQKPSLRPQTTAHLAQTMALLTLTGNELRQKVEAELSTNPALELAQENRCPHCHRQLSRQMPCPICSSPSNHSEAEPIIFVSPRSDFMPARDWTSTDDSPREDWSAAEEDLGTFVLRQIATELDPADRPIAAHILSGLDDNGLLAITQMEIARYHHVPLSRVAKVLAQIQRAEPIGVGSPTPEEALLVQLEFLADTKPVPALAARAIQEGWDLLSRHAFTDLGRLLQISTEQAQQIASFISDNLYPHPGQLFWGNGFNNPMGFGLLQNPDIIISFLENDPDLSLVVEIISPYAGSLRVNPMFRKALNEASKEKLEKWQSDLDSAMLLIKCLQQRDHTLVRLMRKLVTLQRKYILEGDVHLKPITRAQLAIELEVHESTVSRAVSGKAVQLPNKHVILLAKMFDRSLHIRTVIKDIISEESKPLSDQQITNILHQQGYPVARRTVAKYRNMEGILPARLRHPNFSAHP
ncbi:hypothetical protein ACFLZW_04935 [Chloroflexota bacterium]